MTQEDVLERFMAKYRVAREKLAQARRRLKYAEESKGRVVALGMRAAQQKGVARVAAQERDAKAGPDYEVWLNEIADAELEAQQAWTEVDCLEKEWDAYRERAWNKRAEMKLY